MTVIIGVRPAQVDRYGAGDRPGRATIPFRNLIPTRIALALIEANETDLVLGQGTRDRGADCSRIPLRSGIGWVWCDGEPEPTRVRASWISDDDIAATVTAYTPRTPTGDDGLTVIDLTDDKTRRQP
jgi:DNA segregation ATPase FtsK/SpoIIIE, S-DNA-T family